MLCCSSSLSGFTWHGLQIRLRGAYFRRILTRSGAARRRSGENLSSRSRIFASTSKARQAASEAFRTRRHYRSSTGCVEHRRVCAAFAGAC